MAEFRMVDCGEVTLRCAIEGPAPGSAPLAIMVHGFPESWYSWRHQIGPIAAAGFTACAIDVRGYGGSDKPPRIEDYTLEKIAGDLLGLAEGAPSAGGYRELARYGQVNEPFIAWAAGYDDDPPTSPTRNRRRQHEWLSERRCPVLRLEGDLTVAERVALTLQQLAPLSLAAP